MVILIVLLMFMYHNYVDNYDFADDDEYRKIESIWRLFKEFDRDCYKPIKTNDGFAERRNNYIEYRSKGDRYENLSPYLRDLINEHKPLDDDDDTDCAESKVQLVM